MRYLLSLMLVVSALGIIPANSEETDLEVCLASLDNAIVVGSNRNDRTDDGRNIALIKEEEFESPEMIAVEIAKTESEPLSLTAKRPERRGHEIWLQPKGETANHFVSVSPFPVPFPLFNKPMKHLACAG